MARTLADLALGEEGELSELDAPFDEALALMELGFLPGARVALVGAAPGGDPRVYRVDGADVALRHETARRIPLVAPS